MRKISPSFESELRISLVPVIVTLMALAAAVLFVSDSLPDPSLRLQVTLFGILLYTLSPLAWLLDRWKHWVGKWFIIVLLVTIVELVNNWQGVPGTLALMAIPTGLAAALISLPAATAAAVGETVLLLLLSKAGVAGAGWAATGVALVAIWATLAIMVAVYRPVHQLNRWLWEYLQRVQSLLEESRDRKAELEQALDDLGHANRQLALANERMAALRLIAEEAQKSKAAFVARVSHEFRAPLNMIIGLVGLMVESPEVYAEELAPDLWGDLEIVHRNCQHLSSMISDVLDLSQAEAGRMALHRERSDLAEIIDSAIAVVRPLVEKKHLDLQVVIPDDLPEVYCDHTRIRQVILNLVSNAARFTAEGRITVHVGEQDQHIVIGVTDTGLGISPQDAATIFEPFCQGTSEFLRDSGGSGLGLSISKQFVKLHGGQMWLESELGVGSCFFFTLPLSPPVQHVARAEHRIKGDWVWREHAFRTDRPGCTDQLVKPRVVVCDETGTLYPELVRYSDEIEFIDTRDLTQATRELLQCPAHAVVLNADVPGDLLPLLETARRENPETPIIGCSLPRPVERALEAGALGHLTKPVTCADLEEAIQAAGGPVGQVLVVDDDPEVLQLLTRMLHVCDSTLEVTTASGGEQALNKLCSRPYDLVLLDIVMPDMNGWQVLEFAGQDERIGQVPVFLVSAQDPADQPLTSDFLLATTGEGLSISRLLRCALQFSALLLQPDRELDRVLV